MEITGNTFFFGWEVDLIVWLQSQLNSFGIKLASFFTQFGEPMILILVVGLFYWGLDKKYGKYLAVNLFTVCLWGSMIKNVVLRRRPYFDHGSVNCLKPVENGDIHDISLQGFSFPSLHAANATALFQLVARYIKNNAAKIILRILPLLVGISRFTLGVHYPTDVLAGWFFGTMVVLLIDLLLKILPDSRWLYVILLVSGLPGFFFCKSTDFYTSYGLIFGSALAFMFERKYVNFKNAKSYRFALLRLFGGFAIFAGLSVLLKLPFSKELLESATTASFLLRTGRYAVAAFVMLGVYPLCFGKGKPDL